jgi:UDP-glucose 4-epimerase
VEDVARANWLAHEQNAEGVFNIGSGTATKVADLAALVQQCAGHDVEVRNAPPRAGEVRHSVADISAARAFGYQAGTELRAGLLDYLAWLRLT